MTTLWPDWLPLRDELKDLSPYGAPQIDSVARMNTNENPYPLSPTLVSAIVEEVAHIAGTLNRYPDRDAVELRAHLATYLNELSGTSLSVQNIWAANGSNEVIQSLFLALGDRGAVGFVPSYSMHPLIAQVTRTAWSNGARATDFTLDLHSAITHITDARPSLIFVTTPNNPTGTAISLPQIEELAIVASRVGALLVIDEAYAEFSEEPSAVTLLAKTPHLVVIRTMSKAFAFAGARIGYMAADPAVIQAMQLVRLPYHLSSLTQAAGIVALENRTSALKTVASLRLDREKMATALAEMGLPVVPSAANFLLFAIADSHRVWQELVDAGVLIRDVGLSGYLRVTIGTPAENQKFLDALRLVIGGKI